MMKTINIEIKHATRAKAECLEYEMFQRVARSHLNGCVEWQSLSQLMQLFTMTILAV